MLDTIQCLFVNVVVVIFVIVSVVVIVNTFKFSSPELLNQLPIFFITVYCLVCSFYAKN